MQVGVKSAAFAQESVVFTTQRGHPWSYLSHKESEEDNSALCRAFLPSEIQGARTLAQQVPPWLQLER